MAGSTEFMAATENLNILKAIPDEAALNTKLNRLALDYIGDNPVDAAKRVPTSSTSSSASTRCRLRRPRSDRRNGRDIHALVTAVAPIAEIWHWAMMWSAFLFPVLFWLARRPTEAALAGFVPVAYFGAITAASSERRVSTCRCCRSIP